MATDFLLTLLSRDRALLEAADRAGVDRIGIDIERLGKMERQADISSRISNHELADLRVVAEARQRADVFIRLNPWHDGTPAEVDVAIASGATVVMLPHFTTVEEVAAFVSTVGGRATVVLLLETAAAAARLHEIVAVPGVSEIMVGLNDMHRTFGLANHFEMLASDLMASISHTVRDAGLRFGFGGVARPADRSLPIPAELVISQYPRLGATSAWLARSFFAASTEPTSFGQQLGALRASLQHWFAQPPELLDLQHAALRRLASQLAAQGRR
jgi:2-keto-3-deoxy-L-rhamnonate aldolase RhmA